MDLFRVINEHTFLTRCKNQTKTNKKRLFETSAFGVNSQIVYYILKQANEFCELTPNGLISSSQ